MYMILYIEGLQSYTRFLCTWLYRTIYACGLAHRSCVSFSWCTHPKHMEDKWNPFWLKLKFIINQSSGISAMQVHTNSPQLPTYTQKHTYFPHVHPCLCAVHFPVYDSPYEPLGKGLCAPKCCFLPHYCQGIHRWLMMDYILACAHGFPSACDLQQLRALAALVATLTVESTAQGISQRTF